MKNLIKRTSVLLELLAHTEEPMGVYYTDVKPEGGYGPKSGELLTREREAAGQIDWQRAFSEFSCVLGNIWLARKKKAAAWLSHQECGCMGGGYYTGMYAPYLETNVHYVGEGMPGTPMEGEHYITTEGMRKFMDDVEPPRPSGKYCVVKPLSQFTDAALPLLVVFFARPEVLVGLNVLATYATGDYQTVMSPFGACCTQIIGWPLVYQAKGEEKAVLGGFDPSARKFLKTDELTFSMPLSLYIKMLDKMDSSALRRHVWQNDRKKILKSQRAWGEGE